ncbi:isoaspartyl peptidase/L-asparaginase family protein [Sphingomonas glaciei]|uniref:Isoaspartyl peptidase/L-asparaginase n=1 Tax=Sphingomonas glaciei TaxID=2938948 RepID=A0ABY5MS23_9SPHN|nr:isoaspartyl peptidase/L-asparaginase [Sphingomonas glaciei]UUR07197.1 isoaspartyl peptidase/L-asparaginase [Sphingomonas glaciei]
MTAPAQATDWKLVIHGGAGVIERSALTPDKEKEIRAGLDRALAAGAAVLERGGAAVDAVDAAVRVLEDDPNFNAGRGAVFTFDGKNELDASIMDGRTRAAGAVAGVTRTKNPIGLARKVMEASNHVMLSGGGADAFSREQGLEQVDPSYFATDYRRTQLETFKSGKVSALNIEYRYGTVGAVALDKSGHVAAATSTGGMTGKRWNRVGDAPIIGAGTYADDRACAVSATGSGEMFIRVGVAHEICARVRLLKEDAGTAADTVMKEVAAIDGSGGVIVVTPKGEMAYSFNSAGMYRGKADASGRKVAIFGDEERR